MAITLRAVARMSTKRCKKSLFLIPFCFTFANALFGFLSVIEALRGNLMLSAFCIGFAACADALDGRLARALGLSSCLGAELDALCDAISFCCAPTILMYSVFQESMSAFGIALLGIYLCAGLFRLAKFNVTKSSCSAYFSGLSTPVSAFFLATLVLYFDWFSQSTFWFLVDPRGINFVIGALSLLMISTIPFPSFKNRFSLSRVYGTLLVIVASVVLSVGASIPLLILLQGLYIGSALLSYALRLLRFPYAS